MFAEIKNWCSMSFFWCDADSDVDKEQGDAWKDILLGMLLSLR